MTDNMELEIKIRGTTRVKCSCYSIFQDKKYGRGKRLANLMKDPKKSRCTVCGKEHSK